MTDHEQNLVIGSKSGCVNLQWSDLDDVAVVRRIAISVNVCHRPVWSNLGIAIHDAPKSLCMTRSGVDSANIEKSLARIKTVPLAFRLYQHSSNKYSILSQMKHFQFSLANDLSQSLLSLLSLRLLLAFASKVSLSLNSSGRSKSFSSTSGTG